MHIFGFEKGLKDYKLWDPKNKKNVLSIDMIFDESLRAKDVGSKEAHT